jgi:hypothetical protein
MLQNDFHRRGNVGLEEIILFPTFCSFEFVARNMHTIVILKIMV